KAAFNEIYMADHLARRFKDLAGVEFYHFDAGCEAVAVSRRHQRQKAIACTIGGEFTALLHHTGQEHMNAQAPIASSEPKLGRHIVNARQGGWASDCPNAGQGVAVAANQLDLCS